MFDFVHAFEEIFFFGSPCTLCDLRLHFASTWLRLRRYVYTSIGGLRDMGTHGSPPTRVPKVTVKWTQPARSPADLQVGPETLSTISATLEDLERPHPDSGRPTGLVAQVSLLDRDAALPVGLRIMGSSVNMEGNLPNL
jgi:hypothetical protein